MSTQTPPSILKLHKNHIHVFMYKKEETKNLLWAKNIIFIVVNISKAPLISWFHITIWIYNFKTQLIITKEKLMENLKPDRLVVWLPGKSPPKSSSCIPRKHTNLNPKTKNETISRSPRKLIYWEVKFISIESKNIHRPGGFETPLEGIWNPRECSSSQLTIVPIVSYYSWILREGGRDSTTMSRLQ